MDINALRKDTPGAASRLHLDNCGSSLMPRPVIETLRNHLDAEVRLGGYVAQERIADKLEEFYDNAARVFGGARTDYAFTASAVDAWVRAFYSVPMEAGDNIVTAYNEYCANFVGYLHQAKRRGVEIRVVPADSTNSLDPNRLADMVDSRTRLISVSHVPSSSGQINPVAEVGAIAKAKSVPYLLDACQSVGQMPVRVEDIGCDMMTATGRKFLRGPRGTGLLYIAPGMRARLDPVFLTNQSAKWTGPDSMEFRSDARIFEGWERSIANQLGLGAALAYFERLGAQNIRNRLVLLSQKLRDGLASIPPVRLTCPPGANAAIITFLVGDSSPVDLKRILDAEDIAVQVADVSHTRLDLEARGLTSLVRISPHYYNTEAELDRFLNRIAGF